VKRKTAMELLESRCLLSATALDPLAPLLVNANAAPQTIPLLGKIGDPSLGTEVRLKTNLGDIDVLLTDAATPATVANFLKYVNSGRYDNTIIHRSIPGFIIQGGGYDTTGNHIQTFDPVVNEYTGTTTVVAANVGVGDRFTLTTGTGATAHSVSFTATDTSAASVAAGLAVAWNIAGLAATVVGGNLVLAPTGGINITVTASTTDGNSDNSQTLIATAEKVNLRGTIAMAKAGGDPNSATSEWFFSLADNSSNLDNQNGGFTVFGNVVAGMDVVDGIAAVPTFSFNSPFSNLPLQNYTSGGQIHLSNFVTIGSEVIVPNVSLAVTSDNPGVVAASIVDGKLSLTYPGTGSGVAHITITGTSTDQTTASETLTVTRDTAPPTAVRSSLTLEPDNAAFDIGVTYQDAFAVAASTIDNNDLLVTGPNGYSQVATLVSTNLSDSGTIVATYRITNTQGNFGDSGNGQYVVSIPAGAISDTAGNTLAATSLGSFTFDTVAPTAVLQTTTSPAGQSHVDVVVKYSDNLAVDSSTIGTGDLVLEDPHGNFIQPTLISTGLTDGTNVVVTYRYAAPDGTFGPADNGEYTLSVGAGAIADKGGNSLAATALGSFDVNLDPPADGPDLTTSITSSTPGTITPSTKNSIQFAITNSGNALAKGKVLVKVYATTTGTTEGATLLTTSKQSLKLLANASKNITLKFKSPDIADDQYSLLVEVDPDNLLSEQFEVNNSALTSSTVHIIPKFVDLSAVFAGTIPAQLPTKTKATVSVLVTNNGTITAHGAKLALRAETSASGDPGDGLSLVLPKSFSLAAGKSKMVKMTVVGGTKLVPAGSYYILASVTYMGTPTALALSNNRIFSESAILFS